MGGRYGGNINNRGRGTAWSTRKALEAVGREAFGIQFQHQRSRRGADKQPKGSPGVA